MVPSVGILLVSAMLLTARGEGATIAVKQHGPESTSDTNGEPPPCTVTQLVGHAGPGQPGGWIRGTDEVRPSYDCSCPYYKARYFCPHLPEERHSYVWQPHAVAGGECTPTRMETIMEDVFPPGYTVFVFGNSHTRQPVEALLCQFADQVVSRNCSARTDFQDSTEKRKMIGLDEQCRGYDPIMKQQLVNHNCFDTKASRHAFNCRDDTSSFTLRNGASIHYKFSDEHIMSKNILREIASMGLDLVDVDVVFSNGGNGKEMSFKDLHESARALKESETLLVWLSKFYNRNTIYTGPRGKALRDIDVIQFDMSTMMRTHLKPVKEFSHRFVEGRAGDTHYCMPGPPDELGILFARIVWAHFLRQQDV
ncbi:unnamed protein product [Sphacelaria rigidula]